jgi:hypothetical protein
MISSSDVAVGLAAVFVPIGMFGAFVAVVCAAVAMVALARGAAGLCGGAAGIWIVGAMLSIASSFADEWLPLAVSGAALAVGLCVGGILRAVLRPKSRRPLVSTG